MASRRDLFLAQGGKCFYCGKFMKSFPLSPTNPGGYTRDHFYPKSGPTKLNFSENIVLSCFKCNKAKGNKAPTEHQKNKCKRLYRLVSMV